MPQVEIGGAAINYECSGAGELLVLLHEIGGTLRSWDAVAAQLEKRFRVLRYDQRGCGQSEKISGDFSIDTQVDDLAVLIEKFGGRTPCHIAGVAIGSALAIRYAARHPDKVKSLVLACPAPGVSADRIRYLSERAAAVEQNGMGATVENSLGNSYPPEMRRDQAIYEQYRARFLENDPKSYAAINRAFGQFDAMDDLPALAGPALLLAGRHDRLRPPAFVREVAARIPGARYREIDSGHIMPVQAPQAMAAAMAAFYDEIGAGHSAPKSP